MPAERATERALLLYNKKSVFMFKHTHTHVHSASTHAIDMMSIRDVIRIQKIICRD